MINYLLQNNTEIKLILFIFYIHKMIGVCEMAKKIIMDCDPGHDDAIALILSVAKYSTLDILAVTTVAGNQAVEKNTKNALSVLEVIERRDIEVSVDVGRVTHGEQQYVVAER